MEDANDMQCVLLPLDFAKQGKPSSMNQNNAIIMTTMNALHSNDHYYSQAVGACHLLLTIAAVVIG